MATSAVSALFDLYNAIPVAAFGGSARPPLRLGSMSPTSPTGAQQRVPYVVLKDQGFRPEFNSSSGGIENGQFTVEVYAQPLGAPSGLSVDSIVLGLKYGGSTPEAKSGFDWGSIAITGYLYGISIRRTREQREYAGFDVDGQPVHKCTLTYECVTGLNPS